MNYCRILTVKLKLNYRRVRGLLDSASRRLTQFHPSLRGEREENSNIKLLLLLHFGLAKFYHAVVCLCARHASYSSVVLLDIWFTIFDKFIEL